MCLNDDDKYLVPPNNFYQCFRTLWFQYKYVLFLGMEESRENMKYTNIIVFFHKYVILKVPEKTSIPLLLEYCVLFSGMK